MKQVMTGSIKTATISTAITGYHNPYKWEIKKKQHYRHDARAAFQRNVPEISAYVRVAEQQVTTSTIRNYLNRKR